MYVVRIKDRGRDLVVHRLESEDDGEEIALVYQRLGYAAEKIVIERVEGETPVAA
ncbi:MAG: hypothetical protein ACRDFX_01270 [Chloroflexota bacterium]